MSAPDAPPSVESSGTASAAPGARVEWVDSLKGLALIWVFLNHAAERLLGNPHFSNPVPGWPPLSERIRQFLPVGGYGQWGVPLNLFRYLGWTGDQGVQLFLIASGFGLTWGMLTRGAGPSLPVREFYLKRLMRLYPLWWGAHALVPILWVLGETYIGKSFFLSLAGIRFTRSTYYAYSPSWWFVGLLIQLYAVYPMLWMLRCRWGSGRLLVVSAVVCVAARAAGLALLHDYLDPWLRGTVFITRLPEFVLGMALASALHRRPGETDHRLRSPGGLLGAAAVYAVGTALAFTWVGMTVAPFLLGAGALALLYPLASLAGGRAVRWIGVHSYSLYLVHHPLLNAVLPDVPARVTGLDVVRVLAAGGLTVAAALGLEAGTAAVQRRAAAWYRRGGAPAVAWRAGAIVAVASVVLVGLNLLSRRLDPMEIEGWGERPSLEADERYGWKLRPARVTHLRWQGYDYRVTSNALGFPGPDYSQAKPPGTIRLLSTGDAFSSAEGVDTDEAWPRQLEKRIAEARSPQPVEVHNFAITGYGPNQYARVVEDFAPRLRPDLILVELYVNDFEDVLFSDDEFRASIRFGAPDPDGLRAVLRLENLQAWCQSRMLSPLKSRIRGEPDPNALFLRGVAYLQPSRTEWWTAGRDRLAERLAQIKAAADAVGARMAVLMAPAAVQVCSGEGLDLFPEPLDLSNRDRFDPDLPQRLVRGILDDLRIPMVDLRTLFAPSAAGIYQPRNMHWTALGHRRVAEHLCKILCDESSRLLPPRSR